MKIHTLHALQNNFVYVLTDEHNGCAVIDPGEAAPVLDFLNQHHLRLTHVLCTHHHKDHIGGVPELRTKFPDAEVWTSGPDFGRIPGATQTVSEDVEYKLFGQALHILAIPGHTQGQIAYWFPKLAAVFPGDTLFSCGCGRLFEGTPEQMFASLAKLKALPPATQIYFGHEYTLRNIEFVIAEVGESPALHEFKAQNESKKLAGQDTTPTSIDKELQVNPFLMAKSVDEFRKWRERRDLW